MELHSGKVDSDACQNAPGALLVRSVLHEQAHGLAGGQVADDL
jgi:hypothetical protein